MNHIKLFESFENAPDELEAMMTPEEFGAEVDKAIQMGHVEGAKHINSLGPLNLMRSSSERAQPMTRKYMEHMSRYTNHMESFTPDQKIEIRKALNSDYKTAEEQEAERESNFAASQQRHKDYWSGQEREKVERNAPITARRNATIVSKRSDILDRLIAGEITKEEALAAL
jgi:membrane carboxypeptidase/penicillin-binding protein